MGERTCFKWNFEGNFKVKFTELLKSKGLKILSKSETAIKRVKV